MLGQSTPVSGRLSPSNNKKKPNDSGMLGQPKEVESSAATGHGQSNLRCSQRHACKVVHSVNEQSMQSQKHGCLVDRGANGCIVGSDVTVLNRKEHFIDLTGIRDHAV